MSMFSAYPRGPRTVERGPLPTPPHKPTPDQLDLKQGPCTYCGGGPAPYFEFHCNMEGHHRSPDLSACAGLPIGSGSATCDRCKLAQAIARAVPPRAIVPAVLTDEGRELAALKALLAPPPVEGVEVHITAAATRTAELLAVAWPPPVGLGEALVRSKFLPRLLGGDWGDFAPPPRPSPAARRGDPREPRPQLNAAAAERGTGLVVAAYRIARPGSAADTLTGATLLPSGPILFIASADRTDGVTL